jgi:hypothetical protein
LALTQETASNFAQFCSQSSTKLPQNNNPAFPLTRYKTMTLKQKLINTVKHMYT